MTANTYLLASGPGWRAEDVICSSGPADRPFEEQHDGICIAAVTHGTFQYRTSNGAALLSPGALLLGQNGHCFECGHDHGVGDRCLSFHFTPDYFGAFADTQRIARPNLPPLPSLVPVIAAAEIARDEGDTAGLEEAAVCLICAVASSETPRTAHAPSMRDERRISTALRRIEQASDETLPLSELARDAAMSPYHFLRTFRLVVGMTPHQFVLRARLHSAALSLRRSEDNITTIALASGFNDLSTFNRRFRRFMGRSPSSYRTRPHLAPTGSKTAKLFR